MARSITWQIVMETYVAALPRRAILAALVALVDLWLASRWFKEKQRAFRKTRRRRANPGICVLRSFPRAAATGDPWPAPLAALEAIALADDDYSWHNRRPLAVRWRDVVVDA